MASSAEYWKGRMSALEETQYTRTTEYYKELQKQFRMAQNSMQMDIERWYQRLADNNDISLAAAKRLLDKNELDEFHWTVDEYIKQGEKSHVGQHWMKQLENASARVHINRLEAMKLQVQQYAELLYQNYNHGVTEFLGTSYTDNFCHTAYEIARGTGVGTRLAQLDTGKINVAVNTPWAQDEKSFSERIWQSKNRLVQELHTELTQSIILGENPDKAARKLAESMGAKAGQARTLVYTESAAIAMIAQKDCFKELGVEQFEVVETLDSHTCETCGGMDGQHFSMSEFQIGVTAPPFHPNFRVCTCPYFDDEFDSAGERAARGGDGKTYYVPADMTYEEWKGASIDGDMKAVSVPKIRNSKIRNAYDSFNEMLADSEDNSMLTNNMIMYGESTEYIEDITCKSPFAYDTERDAIIYNPQAPNYELYDLSYVQAHELSHRMDIKEYHSWNNIAFQNAIEVSTQKVYDNIETVRGWFAEGGKFENDMALSDIISALTEGKENDFLYSGHSTAYWQNEKSKCLEIFANMCSIEINGYDSKEALQNAFDELYKAFQEMIN